MRIEVEAICGARYATRTTRRLNSRNGFRTRRWVSRFGRIQIAIPKLRRGSYFPRWLLGHVSERALVAFVTDGWIRGIFRRDVEELVRALQIGGLDETDMKGAVASLRRVLGQARQEGALG